MKKSLGKTRIAFAILAAALAAGFFAPCLSADDWNKKTVITVHETMQVENAVLPPGQYVLRLLDSSSNRHVVQIFNGGENHVIATILAVPTERMNATGQTQFTFWETPAGTARAMRDWYYPGDLIGQEFAYPDHPQLLAMASPAPAPPPAPVATQPAPEPPPPPPPPPVVEQPAPNTTPENAAPPEQAPPPPVDNANPAPAASPQPQPAPTELPHTASQYPMLGLSGAVLLGLGALLRRRRLARG